jgi:predicted metal-binding membrane protein
MNPRTRLTAVVAAIVFVVAILAVALTQCGQQPAPGTGTPGATLHGGATAEPGMLVPTLGPTPTPTEGEKAAAALLGVLLMMAGLALYTQH